MKRKSDINIGIRAYEEVFRLFPSDSTISICRRLGCGRKLFYGWRNGCAPSAMFLAQLLELGGDVQYILTGRRTKTENTPDFLAELEEEYS